MPFIPRSESLARLRAQVNAGRPIIGAGAGTGISAKFVEAGGVDIIIIYNSGRYRMAGRGSLAGLLPYGDANAIVVEMASEVLPVVKNTPVLAGVCGTDPFRLMPVFLRQIKEMGFDGVQNFPTVGLFDGVFRANLEETGMGYGLEVDMIRMANEKDMLTTPYVFNEDDATAMAAAGADIIVCHLGLTTGGSIGAETALKLADMGVLERFGVELIGAKRAAIEMAEDRKLFREAMDRLGIENPKATIVSASNFASGRAMYATVCPGPRLISFSNIIRL